MALKLSSVKKPVSTGKRWVTIGAAPKKGEEDERFELLVGSIFASEFRSRHAALRRHLQQVDSNTGIGTDRFDVETAGNAGFIEDESMINLMANHLIFDWKGIVDDNGNVIDYDPEACASILMTRPDAYIAVWSEANAIAAGQEKQVTETVGK